MINKNYGNYAEVIQVIKTTLEIRGAGSDDSPLRIITQYWDFDGNLLAEVDPAPTAGEKS